MKVLKQQLQKGLAAIVFSPLLLMSQNAVAESDMVLQERVLKAREKTHMEEGMDHSKHMAAMDETMGFRGVFYGYLPCKEAGCDGVKMTLSLKHRNNYLLVTQYARESNKELFDKGKYTWDDKKQTVGLTSRKDGSVKQFRIQDEGTLILLNSDGSAQSGDQDEYALRRSDKTQSRQVHIH